MESRLTRAVLELMSRAESPVTVRWQTRYVIQMLSDDHDKLVTFGDIEQSLQQLGLATEELDVGMYMLVQLGFVEMYVDDEEVFHFKISTEPPEWLRIALDDQTDAI